METLANLLVAAKAELGADLVSILDAGAADLDADLERDFNTAQRQLGWLMERESTISWVAGDNDIDLPADYVTMDDIMLNIGSRIPTYRIWNTKIIFTDPLGANQDGGGRILYFGHPEDLEDNGDVSELPVSGDNALVSFAVSRAYKRVASSRAEYKRYSTIMQANGVEMQDLNALSDKYWADFLEARDSLPLREAATYHGD